MMRVSIRSFVGLISLGILMPGLFLLIWSTGKTRRVKDDVKKMDVSTAHEMPGIDLARDRYLESQNSLGTNTFKTHPLVKPESQVSTNVPKEPSRDFPSRKPPRPFGQTIKPLGDPRETPKPPIKGPPRPWIYKNADNTNVESDGLKSESFQGRDNLVSLKVKHYEPDNENGGSQKTWKVDGSPAESSQTKWWKQHISDTCRDLDMPQSPDTLTAQMLTNVIVDDKNKLLFCQIPKVASTTWRRVFLQLTEKVDISDFLSISANDIHHKYDEHFTYLSEFSKDQISQRLRDYFKFVFVREPFERILSAYKNKFFTKTQSANYFKWKFGRRIIAKYRRPKSLIPVNNTGEGVTFEEFASYLIDERQRIIMNEHWEVFHKICHPCLIDYDFVGHLERIDEDSQYVLDLNGLSDRIKVPSRRESKYSLRKTNSYMTEYYSQLKPETISSLYQRYKADYLIFNYTIPADVLPFMYNKSSVHV